MNNKINPVRSSTVTRNAEELVRDSIRDSENITPEMTDQEIDQLAVEWAEQLLSEEIVVDGSLAEALRNLRDEFRAEEL